MLIILNINDVIILIKEAKNIALEIMYKSGLFKKSEKKRKIMKIKITIIKLLSKNGYSVNFVRKNKEKSIFNIKSVVINVLV